MGFYECMTGDEATVYADKAYDNKVFRQNLRAHGIKPRLMHRLYKGDPAQVRKTALTEWDTFQNGFKWRHFQDDEIYNLQAQ